MKLNESQTKEVGSLRESFNKHTLLDEKTLVDLIETEGAPELDEKYLDTYAKIFQLQETSNDTLLSETNVSANIADWSAKLQPMLRRVLPRLMAFDICGVQPVMTPTSNIYMLKAQYSGSVDSTVDLSTSRILQLSQGDTAQAVAEGDTLTSENGAVGVVKYVEPDYSYAVVNVTSGSFVESELVDVGATYTSGDNDITVVAVYDNEAGFKQILPNYSGGYSTATGETLGDSMRQISISIESASPEVTTNAIKAELTIELIQDMKAMHGLSAEKEILFFLEAELVNDINMRIINKFREIATIASSYTVNTSTYGRHPSELYMGLYDRISKDGLDLRESNQTGEGNVLLASSSVIAALRSLGRFVTYKTNGQALKVAQNHGDNYIGTLDNGMAVYHDWFRSSEGYMVIYKGQGAWDNGVIYAPYQPIMVLNAKSAVTLQPVMAIKSRSGIVGNTLKDSSGVSSSKYCTTREVVFTGLPIA